MIESEADDETQKENNRLKEKVARLEAEKEIAARELEHAAAAPEPAVVVPNKLTADEIEELYSQAGAFFEEGKYREAKEKMTQAYVAFGLLKEQDSYDRVRYLRRLCKISNKLQENDQTIAYAIEVAIHAVKDADRAFAYGLLGSAYENKGEYEKAIEYNEKCLAIYKKTLGPEHFSVAITYVNIGLVYKNKGEYDKAIGYYEKALTIFLKSLGADHPLVATTYVSIGAAYSNKGEYDKAIEYYEKALAIQLKTLGPNHPDVGITYNNIGVCYSNKGAKTKALAYLQKAKGIYLKKLGPNHPSTKNVQSWIDKL